MDTSEPKITKLTIRDVAADAGVSTAAVSKVMRNAYGVSDGLRQKVLKSIDKLGYRPSTAARGMRGRTYSVGMLLVDLHNTFLPSVIEGAKDTLRKAGYQTLIGVGEKETAIEQTLIDSMIDLRMDGMLLVAPRLSGKQLSSFAIQAPMTVIGHHEPAAETFDTVNSDDRAGAEMAVIAMLASGCRNVQMISLAATDKNREVHEIREEGYRAAMQAAGLSHLAQVWRIRETPDGLGDPLDRVFDTQPTPDGLFCWSDIHAIEVLNRAHERGIKVPDQLAVVGYDNTPAAQMPLIGLTSLEQHSTVLGRQAAEVLLTRINGRTKAEHLLIQPDLVRRRSTRSSD